MRKVVAGALAAVALVWAHGAVADEAMKSGRTQNAGERKDKEHPLFEGKNNFDLKGKIANVSGDSVTIQRDELPAAKLHVSKDTKIEVDGQKVSTAQLQRGQDVKASFNLRDDRIEAVEIKADKLAKDDSKEMREQSQENQQEMQKRQQEQQRK